MYNKIFPALYKPQQQVRQRREVGREEWQFLQGGQQLQELQESAEERELAHRRWHGGEQQEAERGQRHQLRDRDRNY